MCRAGASIQQARTSGEQCAGTDADQAVPRSNRISQPTDDSLLVGVVLCGFLRSAWRTSHDLFNIAGEHDPRALRQVIRQRSNPRYSEADGRS